MIVFIAPFPALSDEKDGMIQRVASIDLLVTDLPRLYLHISFRRYWLKQTHHFGLATVFQLNAFFHFFFIVSCLKKASVVYIHSVYNSLPALLAYWISKPITDLHGVVPEEELYRGNLARARVYGWVEHIALHRSKSVVFVTSAMKRHYQQKHGRQSSLDRKIPILPKLSDTRGDRENVLSVIRDVKAVIYAGGLQAWQNIPMMIDAAVNASQFRFVFLSVEAQTLQLLAKSSNIVHFTCASVEPHQVPDHYLKCTYGFILRDPVLVNQVACPTKLVEYLYWGVIPIVLTQDIGDFNELGFAYVVLKDFRSGKIPNEGETDRMRRLNRKVAEKLIQSCEGELSTLREVFNYE